MKSFAIILLVCLELVVFSQNKSNLVLRFSTNSNQLNKFQIYKLDSTIRRLPVSRRAYKVTVAGHTDDEGNLEYNEELSLQRAKTVKAFLIKKGFERSNIFASGHAFLQPVAENTKESGKLCNRRVDIFFTSVETEIKDALGYSPVTSTYVIKNTQENILEYSSGTRIHIPARAFIYADGTAVSGSVQIMYTEYRKVTDFISSGIPMSYYNSQNEFVQFNSAGMLKIEAVQHNKKLRLKSESKIKIDFVKTGFVPEMQIFQLDSRNTRWNVVSSANTTAQTDFRYIVNYAKNPGLMPQTCAQLLNGRDYCTLDPTVATMLALRTGHRLANSKNPVYLKRAKHYFVKSQYKMPAYRLQVLKKNFKTITFKIVPENGVDPQLDFSSFEWTYKSTEKYPFKEEWENVLWLRVKLQYLTEKEFYLTLYRNEEELRLSINGKLDKRYLSKAELLTFYENNPASNVRFILDKKTRDEDFQNLVANSPERRLENNSSCDSLFCMYQWSKQWMDTGTAESKLGFRGWLDYFNLNKDLMKERYNYLYLKSDSIYDAIIQNQKLQKYKDSVLVYRRIKQSSIAGNMVQSLGITELGIWNCDQARKLQEPIMVQKKFTDSKGKKIELSSLYVIDKAVNGVLAYNGSYDMGPYKFLISSKAENTLLAFDIENQIYICKPQDFSNALQNNGPIALQSVDQENASEILKEYVR